MSKSLSPVPQRAPQTPAVLVPWWRPETAAAFPAIGWGTFQSLADYGVDAWQRGMLYLDVLRRRGNDHLEQAAATNPSLLTFEFDLLVDGRRLDRPVNFHLVRIRPRATDRIDPKKRPFIVFDPRAGHGPGIGGMKQESEIGVVLEQGHPCYFVGFLPEPIAGQTIEDVCRAEADFIDHVAKLHPEAEGKPCLIGNCQAGWQVMLTSAVRPDLAGPIVLVGSPLSYWAGVHGEKPLRYLGGLLGGSWLTSLAGDLGHGIFDGANLVSNFESMNPANSLWQKDYHLYSNIDTEAERFLEFEKWWGSPVLLNAEEMQFIVDELFIGNKLAGGEIFASDGTRIDLRNISSPIVVFCSWGDDITPPQQALGWILDIYENDDALISGGQTIVYALHQSIGHLGIFVSARVATKEHEEFAQTMDLIDVLPPGLYEAVFLDKDGTTAGAELVSGDYVVRFEPRRLNDIRALGGNDEEDDRRFATAARVSEINQGLYRTFASPAVKAAVSEQSAAWMRRCHPHRARYELFSDKNPWMTAVARIADGIRSDRRPVAADNPFLALERAVSRGIADSLDRYRDLRDQACEAMFLNFYGAPAVQAAVGMRSDRTAVRWRLGRDVAREAANTAALAGLTQKYGKGGLVEASIRALLYILIGSEHPAADQRVFETLRRLHGSHPEFRRVGHVRFKETLREQFMMLWHDTDAAMAALPGLLPDPSERRELAFDAIRQAAESAGSLSGEAKRRLERIKELFTGTPIEPAEGATRAIAAAPEALRITSAKATRPAGRVRGRPKKGTVKDD